MENLWNRAELNNDANAVALLLSDDFVMTVAEGTLYNKAQILASVADKSYKPEVLQSIGLVVHSYGNTAVVTGAFYEKGVDKGKPWERRRTLHRHLDEPGWKVAVHRQPLQCTAEVTWRSPGGIANRPTSSRPTQSRRRNNDPVPRTPA